ncbi:MAG: RodZ domain-containing protein [Pseudomonadota bacterium]
MALKIKDRSGSDRIMPPLGERLRTQRKALNMSIADAARACGVRQEFLCALERHDLAALPTIGYGLGYVRAYARVLGLDTEQAVADFKRDSEIPHDLNRPDSPHFVPKRRVRLPKGSIPALGAVAAVVMLGTWYGVQLDTVASPDPAVVSFDPEAVEDSAPTPDTVLTLRTTAPSWVSIRDGRGRRIVNRVFITGESWQMDVGSFYTVDVRDAGAVELLIGETSLGALGPQGEPITDLDLSSVR